MFSTGVLAAQLKFAPGPTDLPKPGTLGWRMRQPWAASAGLAREGPAPWRQPQIHPSRHERWPVPSPCGCYFCRIAAVSCGLPLGTASIGNTFVVYKSNPNARDTLSSNFLHDLMEDDHGFLWFASNNGVSKFNPQNRALHAIPS